MGKAWLFSIATAWALVGLSVGCAGSASPLAAGDKPAAGFFTRLTAPLYNSSSLSSSGKLTHNHQQRLIKSPLFDKSSHKKQPFGERLAGAVKENPLSSAVSSFAKRSTELLTPKPRVVRAIDPLSLSHKSPSPDANLYVQMAKMNELNGNTIQAAQLYQKALDIAPNDIDALLGYAHLIDRQEQFEEAIRLYLQVTSRYPDHARAYNDLGLCYARQGMLAEAVESLERAVVLQPQRKLYRNNIATVLVEIQRTDEALNHLTAVYGKAVAHYNIGYLLHMRGMDRQAVGHFTVALHHNPSLAPAQLWLGRLGNQVVGQIASQSVVEVTDLPAVQSAFEGTTVEGTTVEGTTVEGTTVEGTTEYGVAPEPTPIPSYLQQHRSQSSAGRYEGIFGGKRRAEAPATGSLQVPSQIPNENPSGGGILPPSPEQVYQYRISAAPRALPPVSGNEVNDRGYY